MQDASPSVVGRVRASTYIHSPIFHSDLDLVIPLPDNTKWCAVLIISIVYVWLIHLLAVYNGSQRWIGRCNGR